MTVPCLYDIQESPLSSCSQVSTTFRPSKDPEIFDRLSLIDQLDRTRISVLQFPHNHNPSKLQATDLLKMQFFSSLFLAFASLAAAGTVHFVNQDNIQRTVVFTEQVGLQTYANLVIPPLGTAAQEFATGWIGNWYAVPDGSPLEVPGMLGEVRFDGFAGATYFDVSAIVNPNDVDNVKMILPKNSDAPISGCQSFPCSNAYNQPNDIATLSTTDSELICLLGNLSNDRKRGLVARMRHEFVEGSL